MWLKCLCLGEERLREKFRALFLWSVVCLLSLGATGLVTPVQAQDKPNIVVIMDDDIVRSSHST